MTSTHKSTLDNGVRILSKHMPHTRSVSMGVWVNVGARDESPGENGLSHMIEHMIFKGTSRRSALQIAKEFDAIGGHTNAFTSFENTCYHAKVLDTHAATMADVLCDIFLNSLFDEAEIAKERPVIFQEMSMVEDSPEEYIHVLTGKTHWGDNPLGRSILGTKENLLHFDSNIVRSFFHRYYQPEHIVISAAGNISHTQAVDLIASAFEHVSPGNGLPDRITPLSQNRIDLNARDLEQVHICLSTPGISITDPNRFAFSLLNTILGGNMSSRLFQTIRESKGYAYSIYSFLMSYVDTGMFGIYAGVNPDNTVETLRLILNETQQLATRRVSAAELQDAKEFTKGNLLMASESVDNQMVRLAQNEINFGRQIPLQEVVDQIEAVSVDDIMALAASLFKPDGLSLTTLGPFSDQSICESILGR